MRALKISVFAAALSLALWRTVLTGQVGAHEAPLGWSYSWQCCSGTDCQQVENDATIIATAGGWLIGTTGETIAYSDTRIKQSQDEHFHRCHKSDGSTRCLYVPPQAY